MRELPLQYKKSINKYEPISVDGLTLYPIRVSEYEEFLIARHALDFVVQSLPVQMMSMPVLQAFFKIDFEKATNGEETSGLFASALIGLSLALRLSQDTSLEALLGRFRIVPDPKDPSRLKQLEATIDGIEQIAITPVQYAKLRTIIAAQNGVEMPDEMANPELLQAERDLAQAGNRRLDYKVEDMIISVAAAEGKNEEDLYEWPILKLNRHMEHHQRRIDYMICGIAEAQGTTWKGGNPAPSPIFARSKGGSSALVDAASFAGGQALSAINNPSESKPD